MPIVSRCKGCGHSFRAPEKLLGRRVKCPQCGDPLTVAAVKTESKDKTLLGEIETKATDKTLLGEIQPPSTDQTITAVISAREEMPVQQPATQPSNIRPAPPPQAIVQLMPAADAQTLACPHCRKYMVLRGSVAGQVVACPHCGCHIHMMGVPHAPAMSPLSNELEAPVIRSLSSYQRHRDQQSGAGVILVVVGMLVIVAVLGGLYVTGVLGDKLTESVARNKLKEALDSWVFGDDPELFRIKHPDVNFSDMDWGVRTVLLRYEITSARKCKTYSKPGEDRFEFSVVLSFQSRAGTELKQSKKYEVSRPSGKKKIDIQGW